MLRSSGTAPRNLFTVHRLKSRSNHTPTQPCKLTMPPLPLVRPLVRPAALATGMPSLICRTWVRPFSGVAAARTPRSPCRRLNPTTSGDPSTPILLKLFPSRSSSFPRSSTQLFARQLNTMAPAKEYSLFCLENPLLGMYFAMVCSLLSPPMLDTATLVNSLLSCDCVLTSCSLSPDNRHPGVR